MACSIRPATLADLPAIIRLYLVDFWDEQFMDLVHPFRNQHPADFERFVADMLTERWWTLGYERSIDVLVSDGGEVVGFAWWRRSWTDEQKRSRTEGWLTLRTCTAPLCSCSPSLLNSRESADSSLEGRWVSPLIIFSIRLRTKLRPYRSADPAMAGAEKRALPALLPLLRERPSRQRAWLLQTLAMDPAYQKKGLGTMLVQHGLTRVDNEGLTVWLLSMKGVEGWYERLGFVEKGRANIGELARWEGGAVMFRERE
jgi:predicted N-acetyltransferase YhbS